MATRKLDTSTIKKIADMKLTAAQKAAVKAGGKIEMPASPPAANYETVNDVLSKKTRTPAQTKALVKNAKTLAAKGVKPGTKANPIIATFDGKPPKGVTKKPAAPVVKYKGQVIPVKRKNGQDGLDVPTIEVKNVAETVKVFALLPKGCSWVSDSQGLNIFNGSSALIACLHSSFE